MTRPAVRHVSCPPVRADTPPNRLKSEARLQTRDKLGPRQPHRVVDGDGSVPAVSSVVAADLVGEALAQLPRSEHFERFIGLENGLDSAEELPDVLGPVSCRLVRAAPAAAAPDPWIVSDVIRGSFVNRDLGPHPDLGHPIPPTEDAGALGVDPDQGESLRGKRGGRVVHSLVHRSPVVRGGQRTTQRDLRPPIP